MNIELPFVAESAPYHLLSPPGGGQNQTYSCKTTFPRQECKDVAKGDSESSKGDNCVS